MNAQGTSTRRDGDEPQGGATRRAMLITPSISPMPGSRHYGTARVAHMLEHVALSDNRHGACRPRKTHILAESGNGGDWMLRSDFNFIIDLKKNFFAQRKIQLLLATIERNRTAGWEPWWQVEFARFLYQHQDGHEWAREHHIGIDHATGAKDASLIADFMIKPRNSTSDRSILLEFKQSDSVKRCITNMAKDIRKVEKTKPDGTNQRSFWVVGAHPRECKNAVRKTVETVAAEYGIRLFDIETRYILNTGYAFTVF